MQTILTDKWILKSHRIQNQYIKIMVFDILELENWKIKEFVYRNIKIIYLEINIMKGVQDHKALLKEWM